jgi:hypothetical protein
VEEIYEEPDAVIGTFLLNNFPALILFDTGASHSFISMVFLDRNKLPTQAISVPLRVSSLGGEIMANSGCHRLIIRIGEYCLPTSLIVLELQGLDVILGMNWMTKYEGIIDCAK